MNHIAMGLMLSFISLHARKRLRDDPVEQSTVKFAEIIGTTGTVSVLHSNMNEDASKVLHLESHRKIEVTALTSVSVPV